MAGTELVRANKVTVKADANGRYVADFYRTHKQLTTVLQDDTDWEVPQDATKTGERESFRQYVIKNAEKFGIDWNPKDMRSKSNIRRPRYENDDQLISDAIAMVEPDIKEIIEKCRYDIEYGGIEVDDISPMEKTSKGVPLSGLGVIDGKYEKSGNWAWANINMNATIKFKDSEVYYSFITQLVSGQLKKPKLTITAFTENIRDEIVNAGLATVDELDPPKETTDAKVEDTEAVQGNEVITDTEVTKTPEVIEEDIKVVQDTQDKVADSTNKIQNKSGRPRKVLGKKEQ